MTAPSLDPKLRNRLMRFLHVGTEFPKYFPGCWSAHKYYEVDKVQVINEIFTNGFNNVEVINIILKAYKDGWYTRFEPIAFALTKCILLGSENVKTTAYKVATKICVTPEQLMIFNKFTRLLKTGNGHGWRQSIKEWYMGKQPMELVKEMTRVRSRSGRSHKILLRKSHIKIPREDHARDAVIKYAIFGLKRAKQLIGNTEGTKEIFDYIQIVENMRVCEDPAAAGAMAAQYHFTLDHVPGHLLTAQDVWNAVLPQMTLEQLLSNIQRIHNMGFLTSDSTTTAILVSLLGNKDVIQKSKVTPLAVYIARCNYKKNTRPMTHAKRKVAAEKENRRRSRQAFDAKTGLWQWTVTRRHPKEVKNWGIDIPPNPAVLAALEKLMDQSWLLTKPTNVRYMITLDMRQHMFKGRHFCKTFVVPKKGKKATVKSSPIGGGDADSSKKSKRRTLAECFYNRNVTPGHAAVIMALQILKREKNVKLAVFTEEGVHIVNIGRKVNRIEDAENTLKKASLGRVQLDAPIEWASKNKHKVDVFINMVDRTSRYMELDLKARGGRGSGGRYGPPPDPTKEIPDHCPVRALERYRRNVGMPDAKLIVMSLSSHRVQTTDGSHEGVLDVVGVDEHVPKVIDAFALGQFK